LFGRTFVISLRKLVDYFSSIWMLKQEPSGCIMHPEGLWL
jgi:hypothetical protein